MTVNHELDHDDKTDPGGFCDTLSCDGAPVAVVSWSFRSEPHSVKVCESCMRERVDALTRDAERTLTGVERLRPLQMFDGTAHLPPLATGFRGLK